MIDLMKLPASEAERLAYAEGFAGVGELLARLSDAQATLDEAKRLLAEVLEYIENGDPPSPSGDWAVEVKKVLP